MRDLFFNNFRPFLRSLYAETPRVRILSRPLCILDSKSHDNAHSFRYPVGFLVNLTKAVDQSIVYQRATV
jgi:hypothetical protein